MSRSEGRSKSSGQRRVLSLGQKSLEHWDWAWPETSWTAGHMASLSLSAGPTSRRLGRGVRSETEAQS